MKNLFLENHIKIGEIVIIGLLSFTATFSTTVLAQESVIELLRAGQREVALAEISSGDFDVNEATADGSTALLWATYSVDHEVVKALLEAGAEADVTNSFGASALSEAVKLNDFELVQALIAAGANPDSPNQDNQTALMLAAFVGSLKIAELLVSSGADVSAIETFRGQTALMWAASENHPDIAELLVANGADVSVRAVHDDWQRQMTSEPRAQFRATGGLTALLYAARSGCYRCAVAIVEGGADVNQPNPDGVTPLINALDGKSFDIALYLIDQGANVEAWDMNGRTPLYVAVDMNSFTSRGFFGFGAAPPVREPIDATAMDVVNRLLELGVDVNHQLTRIRPNGPGRGRFADYMMRGGVGPLMVATLSYDNEAVEVLLAHGAEVDLLSVFQITPLMAAAGLDGTGRGRGGPPGEDAQARAIKTIDLLLDAGANINTQITNSYTYTAKIDTYIQGRDQEGRTGLFAAAELGWDRVVAHLINRGADPSIEDAAGTTALDAALAPVRAGPGAQEAVQPNAEREATIALLSSLAN